MSKEMCFNTKREYCHFNLPPSDIQNVCGHEFAKNYKEIRFSIKPSMNYNIVSTISWQKDNSKLKT